MNFTHHFNLRRFWLLLKLELYRSRNAILMTFVITFGLLFFVGFLLDIAVSGSEKNFYEFSENYAICLIAGGFILSSLAFHDLGNTLKSYNYFTLPVSTLERFLCMWLLTSIGWILLFTITYSIFTVFAIPVGSMLNANLQFNEFHPLSPFAIDTMKSYFVLQGLFLVGAAHFKGYAFPKTLFTLVLFALTCIAILYFSLKDIFLSEHKCDNYECELVDQICLHRIWAVGTWLFWWALAPLCWVVTYLGLRDQEV